MIDDDKVSISFCTLKEANDTMRTAHYEADNQNAHLERSGHALYPAGYGGHGGGGRDKHRTTNEKKCNTILLQDIIYFINKFVL